MRATVVGSDGSPSSPHAVATPPVRSSTGTVEIDAEALFAATVEVAEAAIAESPERPAAVSIATQRASTVLFDRRSGRPSGAALSWQDVRTTGQCLMLRPKGFNLLPSQSATKLAWLLAQAEGGRDRGRWCFGTLESYLAFRLSHGAAHVTDATNAAVTGLVTPDASRWDERVLDALGIPAEVCPVIVDSTAQIAAATALSGAPVIAGLVGDQQASLIGQGCVVVNAAKLTFGTGAMLDLCLGPTADPPERGGAGTFPIVAWRDQTGTSFGLEAMILSAGSAIDWLVSGLGVLGSAEESEPVARGARDAGGVTFVPALGGLGTPVWDYGARGAFIGISAATTRAEMVRSVLEGIAHRARDLVDAIEADAGTTIDVLHLDGGMCRNELFVQLVANAVARPVLRSRHTEATTLGAAMLAGVATRSWHDLAGATAIVPPPSRVEPSGSLDRDRWLDARARAMRTVPALSALTF